MRLNKIAAAIAATSVLLTVQALPANAAPTTIFSDGIVVGNVRFDMNSDWLGTSHIYGWDDVAVETLGDSTTHANGEFWIYNTDAAESFGAWCDADTAEETASGADRVVTCDAQSSEVIYTDLSIKPEVRIFPADANGVATVRVLYAVTNNGVADVTVDEVRSTVDGDEDFGAYTTNVSDSYGTPVFDQATDVNWFNLITYNYGNDQVDTSDDSIDAVMTTYGSAWQSTGATVRFTSDGDWSDDDDHSLFATDVTFAAGETVYFAFFTVAAFIPADPSDAQVDAVEANTVAALRAFDGGLNATYGAGIPAGAKVLNWTAELADTGVDATGTLGFAAALLVAGAAVVVARRRVRA